LAYVWKIVIRSWTACTTPNLQQLFVPTGNDQDEEDFGMTKDAAVHEKFAAEQAAVVEETTRIMLELAEKLLRRKQLHQPTHSGSGFR